MMFKNYKGGFWPPSMYVATIQGCVMNPEFYQTITLILSPNIEYTTNLSYLVLTGDKSTIDFNDSWFIVKFGYIP